MNTTLGFYSSDTKNRSCFSTNERVCKHACVYYCTRERERDRAKERGREEDRVIGCTE